MQDDMNRGNPGFLTGIDFSQLLVHMIEEQLASRQHPFPVTKSQIAEHLGVTRQMVQQVLAGVKGFGRKFLERMADGHSMTLSDFLLHLTQWHGNRRPLSANPPETKILFDFRDQAPRRRKDPLFGLIDHFDASLLSNLRHRFWMSCRYPDMPAFRLDAEGMFKQVLNKAATLLDESAVLDWSNLAVLVSHVADDPKTQDEVNSGGVQLRGYLLARSSQSDAPDPQMCDSSTIPLGWHTATSLCWQFDQADRDYVFPRVMWLDATLYGGIETQRDARGAEEMQTSRLDSNASFNTTFLVCFPVHEHVLPSDRSPAGAYTTRTSLLMTLRAIEPDAEVRKFIDLAVRRIGQVLEYVCLSVIQDIVTTCAFTDRRTAHNAQQFLLWKGPQPVEHIEHHAQKLLNFLFIRRTDDDPALRDLLSRLLSTDIWIFDNRQWDFLPQGNLRLHRVSKKAACGVTVVVPHGYGEVATYERFYKDHVEQLKPRSKDGRSIHCIAHRQVEIQNPDDRKDAGLVADVLALEKGTKIGLPFDVISSNNSEMEQAQSGVAWLRFGVTLCADEAQIVIQGIHKAMNRIGSLHPRFDCPNTRPTQRHSCSPSCD